MDRGEGRTDVGYDGHAEADGGDGHPLVLLGVPQEHLHHTKKTSNTIIYHNFVIIITKLVKYIKLVAGDCDGAEREAAEGDLKEADEDARVDRRPRITI